MAERVQVDASIELVDAAVRLRPYRPSDASALFAAARESIPSVGRWLPWCHADYAESDSAAWIDYCTEQWQRGAQYTFAVFGRDDERFFGSVGLSQHNRAHNFAGMGYWIRDSAQGQGLATRAGRLLANFGFAALGLGRVEILVAVDNDPSRRTANAIGAAFEGVARNRLIMPDRRTADAAVYALIPSDIASWKPLAR